MKNVDTKEVALAVELQPWRATLLKAAQLIRECGWCQREYTNADGGLCIYGAISVAMGHVGAYEGVDDHRIRICTKLRAKLRLAAHASVHEWNDHPERTAAEVISALEGAALEGVV